MLIHKGIENAARNILKQQMKHAILKPGVIPENAVAFIRDLYGHWAMALGTIPDSRKRLPG